MTLIDNDTFHLIITVFRIQMFVIPTLLINELLLHIFSPSSEIKMRLVEETRVFLTSDTR